MRPIELRFQCFGPYLEEQVIDFEKLEQEGLFLISGETGAGKTTILDAMTYALYGRSSGGLRGDLSVMRCNLADKEETRVSFVFESNGKHYQFTRSLRYGTKRLNDFHNCSVFEDGNYVPIFENPKLKLVNQEAERIIGLSYNQFRQVIILPQGQFEKLLVSESAEKEAILVSLFKAEKWQKIADKISERVSLQEKKWKDEMLTVTGRLAEYQCKTVEELSLQGQKKQGELVLLNEQLEQAQANLEQVKIQYDKAVLLSNDFSELEIRQKRQEQLQRNFSKMKELNALLQRSDHAEEIKGFFDTYQLQLQKKQEWEQTCKKAVSAQAKAEKKQQDIQKKKEELEKQKGEYEEAGKILPLLENVRSVYEALDAQQQEVLSAQKSMAEKQKQLAEAQKKADASREKWQQKMEEQTTALEAYQTAQSQYLSGIYGTLAGKLVNGKACPVCGSIEHPNPAKTAEIPVTEEEVDQRNKQLEECSAAVRKAAEVRTKEQEKKELAERIYQKTKDYYTKMSSIYQQRLQQKIQGIDTSAKLEQKIKASQQILTAYQKEAEQMQKLWNDAQASQKLATIQITDAETGLQESEKVLEANSRQWQIKRAQAGFEADNEFLKCLLEANEKNKKREQLAKFQADLESAAAAVEEQRQKVKTYEKPDLQNIKQQLTDAERKREELWKQQTLEKNELERLWRDEKKLTGQQQKCENVRQQITANLEFANRVRGKFGISLQRYVLGVMFSSITVEANRLLESVHNGRYQLYRTNETAGSSRKSGLELEVLDRQSNERRSVTTLSGGEKFLVALSLAIGLSTVVQAQGNGIRLGAMFVDEGFGSLDQHSIYDALEVLQKIQKANGLVGIISHVELLDDTIPCKIKIVKGKNGSTCMQ